MLRFAQGTQCAPSQSCDSIGETTDMDAKQAAGEKSAEFVEDGMIVGLGSGSTARCAIEAVGRRLDEGLRIQSVATSVESQELAQELGIPLLSLNEVDHIDLTIDGADEIDGNFDMIKGGGGALLREKIVAACTDVEVIVADPSKSVAVLGRGFALPVEVVPFGWGAVQRWLAKLACSPELRLRGDEPYETDNDNFILDCKFEQIPNPSELEQAINDIPGVVANGLFVGLAQVLIVGEEDGHAEVQDRRESG